MYLHCTAYKKKKYQLRTDISSIQTADDKHALDLVVMVTGPSLLKKKMIHKFVVYLTKLLTSQVTWLRVRK
jgi:hypothetical protein